MDQWICFSPLEIHILIRNFLHLGSSVNKPLMLSCYHCILHYNRVILHRPTKAKFSCNSSKATDNRSILTCIKLKWRIIHIRDKITQPTNCVVIKIKLHVQQSGIFFHIYRMCMSHALKSKRVIYKNITESKLWKREVAVTSAEMLIRWIKIANYSRAVNFIGFVGSSSGSGV